MKKKIVIVTTCFLTVGLMFTTIVTNGKKAREEKKLNPACLKEALQKNEEAEKNGENEIVYSDEYINITENDIRYQTACVVGDTDNITDEQTETIEDKILEHKEMYRVAVEAGFSYSDEEYNEFEKEMRKTFSDENTVGKEDIQYVYDGFGGEEEYWRLIRDYTKEKLTVRKYLDSLEAEYMGTNEVNGDNLDKYNKWNNKEEKMKEKARDKAKARMSQKNKEKIKKIIKAKSK